jgi:NAD(P)-dependent dehydrogenase (short-subunit alcohol dehydrogenase family)
LRDDPIADVARTIVGEGQGLRLRRGRVQRKPGARLPGRRDQPLRSLDILINNAGVLLANAETDDMPVDVFDEHIRCNVRSAFLTTKFALPYLRQTAGNVISAGSEGGVNGQPRNTTYGGTKAFLHAFMAGVAVEQAQYGVRANCVCPGPIDTAWTHAETGFVTGAVWMVDGGITPAKGPVGMLAGRKAATPPRGSLDLRHAHDGTRHQRIVKIP